MSSGNPETRARILEAAWVILEESDGSPVRMSDIAKRAGVSRQALYLHFPTRTDLLSATTRYIDGVKDIQGRLSASRTAPTGEARMEAFIDAWAGYIPEIYKVSRTLMAMGLGDEAARSAWSDCMAALREGCEAAVTAMAGEGRLRADMSGKEATDILWTILSVRNWEHLRQDCDWSQEAYRAGIQSMARRLLVGEE